LCNTVVAAAAAATRTLVVVWACCWKRFTHDLSSSLRSSTSIDPLCVRVKVGFIRCGWSVVVAESFIRIGSVRGVRNGVRRARCALTKRVTRARVDTVGVTVYMSSCGAVRDVTDRCRQVLHILHTNIIEYTVKDLFVNDAYADELRRLLPCTIDEVGCVRRALRV
jgi:hypothetical protein